MVVYVLTISILPKIALVSLLSPKLFVFLIIVVGVCLCLPS